MAQKSTITINFACLANAFVETKNNNGIYLSLEG